MALYELQDILSACLEVLQILYPKLHLTSLAIVPVNRLGCVVPVAGHNKADVGSHGTHLYLHDDSLRIFPRLGLVIKLIIPPDKNH